MKLAPLVLLLCSAPAFCGSAEPSGLHQWVPQGWKIVGSKTGDLNQDGLDDTVLVLQEDDPAKRKPNDGLGAPVLNLNPRRLVILFRTPAGHQEIVSADDVLPSEHEEDNPCQADPLENGGVEISRGTLRIDLHYSQSCGSYGVSHQTFIYRHENGRFRLIGQDTWESMRNSGERTEYSTNYLTGRRKTTTGLNEFRASTPKIEWERIETTEKVYLGE